MRRLAACALLTLLAAAPATRAASRSDEATWLADYLRIDTTNPPGNEAPAAAFLAGLLQRGGIATERHVTPSGRTSLVARLPATVSGAPWIALVHHLDVVPAEAGWTAPPFGGEVRDGYLVGRGAIDTKSLGIAHLAALVDAARFPERRRGLMLVAVADEENGGAEGMGWLVAKRPELFQNVEAALGEGGFNRTVLGRTFFWGLEVAQKRAYWLALTARGRAGHGSSLNPDSAAHELVRALTRLVDRPREWKLQPPVRDFFRAYAALDPSLRGAAFDPDAAIGPTGPAAWVPPGWWGLLLDTAQVTALAAGERPNVVAGEATARLDLRLLPETDADAYLAALRATLGDRVDVEVVLATPPSPPSPVGTPVWRALERAIGERAPLLPAMIPGITDSRYLRARGIPSYGFSPFELEAVEMLRVHGVDERIPLDRFDAGVARMKRVVRELVAPTG
jgi:acetylornithine deacetylase/succinyl-diaminopimelate desuccinylase-like protein